MKSKISKILCLLLSTILLFSIPQHAKASELDSVSPKEDSVVLTIDIGNEMGQIGYSDTMQGGGDGPEAFTVTADETIYIVDNVNKRINVYKEGSFLYDINIPYIIYVRSIVVSQKMVYLMDYDAGNIYVVDLNGALVKDISITQNMESYLMRKLYAREDGSVWLYYENNTAGNSQRGTDHSYNVDDLANGKVTSFQGYMYDDNRIFSVTDRNLNTASICTTDSLMRTSNDVINLSTNEYLAQFNILNVDNNQVFVDVFEMVDTSIVAGEYTVRKFTSEGYEGISLIDLGEYYFMPNNVIEISEVGELYQIKCYFNKVEIVKKAFIEPENFKSNIAGIKTETLALEAELNTFEAKATVNAPNDYIKTYNNAYDCCQLSWTYNAANANNPNSSNVTIPTYLSGVSKPASQTGIPYCWGGFDGLSTSSSSSWSSFSDAMSKNKFAGNINTSTTGYQSGTAGFDCSGFVSSTAGFTSKLSTTNLASSTYTKTVSLSNRTIYDIYVKSGSHVLYYVGLATNGISSRESTTTGEEKTKLYTRSTAWLSGYTLRRFNGW